MAKNREKRDGSGAGDVRCPKCGRKKAVRRMEHRLYRCEHCHIMFEVED